MCVRTCICPGYDDSPSIFALTTSAIERLRARFFSLSDLSQAALRRREASTLERCGWSCAASNLHSEKGQGEMGVSVLVAIGKGQEG